MTIVSDTLHVSLETHDINGQRFEPEERPAARVLHVDAPLMDQFGKPLGGQIPTSVAIERPVIEFAQGQRSICGLCKHWDQDAWHKLFVKISSTKNGISLLNGWRHALMTTGNAAMQQAHPDSDGEGVDADLALRACGMCRPLTEATNRPIVTYPASSCPEFLPSEAGAPDPSKPFPLMFENRDLDTERRASGMFDNIMRTVHSRMGKVMTFLFRRKES